MPDRYCDLVLTGGVTSAIAYPGVIHGLAQVYRFNSIGGSSSGAGSAALAAAAEYRRRHGSSDGFRTMLRRTSDIKRSYGAKTGLRWLFQPDRKNKRLFGALLRTFAGPKRRKAKLIVGVGLAYWRSSLAPIAVAFAVTVGGACFGSADRLGGFVAAFFAVVLFALIWTAYCLWNDLKRTATSDYGLCGGQQSAPGAAHSPLTPWLHDLIQDIAGLPADRPLTFADLRDAPGSPRETLGDASANGARSIDLRMFAADVTQGRPLLLPQAESDPPLYFRPLEMRRLFPGEVVDAMKRHSKPCGAIDPENEPKGAAPTIPSAKECDGEDHFWELPRLALPVIVAARMSVGFPVLFSAVPLWQRAPGSKRFRRLLIADGGLCSNFPIHLFDSPIPGWPTFGVSLYEGGGDYSLDPVCIANRVRVPQRHGEQRSDTANTFDLQTKPKDRMLGYIVAMLSTVKDWNDALLAELPGVRERVAEVALPDDIGGLNILMDAEQIECLALLGGEVARQLLARYAVPDGSGSHAPGWREHRWVRFNVLSECLQQSFVGLSRSALHARHAEPIRDQIRRAIDEAPLAGDGEVPLNPAQAAALERTLDALLDIERALMPRPLKQPYQPVPPPELRIRPPM